MAAVQPYGKVINIGNMEEQEKEQWESSVHGEYSKVEAFIPIEARVLPADAEELKSRVSTDLIQAEFKELPEHDDRLLSAWLRMLNAKLDAILSLLEKDREQFYHMPHLSVELSGGGICLPFAAPAAPGDRVEMKMMIPIAPPVALYIYGKAVKVERGRLWVNFSPMDEEIRDRLVHYVFLRQREIFRERRENRRSVE